MKQIIYLEDTAGGEHDKKALRRISKQLKLIDRPISVERLEEIVAGGRGPTHEELDAIHEMTLTSFERHPLERVQRTLQDHVLALTLITLGISLLAFGLALAVYTGR